MNLIDVLKNKKVGLIGLGKSNVSLANYLLNYTSDIFITEILEEEKVKQQLDILDTKVRYECGKHSEEIFNSDIVIKSPGIAEHNELIKKIREKKIPVSTELEIAYQIIINKLNIIPKIVAVTGTNGKTTTTTLIGKILGSYYKNVIVAGNIGIPLIEFVDKIQKDSILVLEVSSYQLENITEFKPHIACLLNITEDHLEHHINIENYITAKSRIFMNQNETDFAVLNYDSKMIQKINFHKVKSRIIYFSKDTRLVEGCSWDKKQKQIIFVDDNFKETMLNPVIKILGEHNLENILCSVTSCLLLKVPKEIIEKNVSEFYGVEHRLEFVRELNGVVYINDSKSTNVDSTLVALKSFDKPIHLILGGRDKGAPYTPLLPLIKTKVKTILLIGEATEIIFSQLKNYETKIIKCGNLETAVKTVKQFAKQNEIVLLSPACSSFDQYKNFEHRGKEFKRLVNNL